VKKAYSSCAAELNQISVEGWHKADKKFSAAGGLIGLPDVATHNIWQKIELREHVSSSSPAARKDSEREKKKKDVLRNLR
jgi:hypothetical protein